MNEYIKEKIKAVLMIAWILFCAFVVLKNYQPTGHIYVVYQFLGILGILLALYIYNRKYK